MPWDVGESFGLSGSQFLSIQVVLGFMKSLEVDTLQLSPREEGPANRAPWWSVADLPAFIEDHRTGEGETRPSLPSLGGKGHRKFLTKTRGKQQAPPFWRTRGSRSPAGLGSRGGGGQASAAVCI